MEGRGSMKQFTAGPPWGLRNTRDPDSPAASVGVSLRTAVSSVSSEGSYGSQESPLVCKKAVKMDGDVSKHVQSRWWEKHSDHVRGFKR